MCTKFVQELFEKSTRKKMKKFKIYLNYLLINYCLDGLIIIWKRIHILGIFFQSYFLIYFYTYYSIYGALLIVQIRVIVENVDLKTFSYQISIEIIFFIVCRLYAIYLINQLFIFYCVCSDNIVLKCRLFL